MRKTIVAAAVVLGMVFGMSACKPADTTPPKKVDKTPDNKAPTPPKDVKKTE